MTGPFHINPIVLIVHDLKWIILSTPFHINIMDLIVHDLKWILIPNNLFDVNLIVLIVHDLILIDHWFDYNKRIKKLICIHH
ncbi:hypothetical protein Hdeb2414_s0008g00272671 [Helianthus debilis subsp. tardiflorus]